MGCIIGVSTSREPLPTRKRRMACMIRLGVREVRRSAAWVGGDGSLAERAQGGHRAGESGRDGLALEPFLGRRAVPRDQIAGAVLNVKLPAEGIDPQTSQLLQLLEPLGDLVV